MQIQCCAFLQIQLFCTQNVKLNLNKIKKCNKISFFYFLYYKEILFCLFLHKCVYYMGITILHVFNILATSGYTNLYQTCFFFYVYKIIKMFKENKSFAENFSFFTYNSINLRLQSITTINRRKQFFCRFILQTA